MKDIEFVKASPFFGFPQASEEPIDPNPNPSPSSDGSIQYLEIPYEHCQFLEIEKVSSNYFIQTPCMRAGDSTPWNIAIKMPDDQQFPFNAYFEASNANSIGMINFIFKVNGQYDYYKLWGVTSRLNFEFYNSEYGITVVTNKLSSAGTTAVCNSYRIGNDVYFAANVKPDGLWFINPFSDAHDIIEFEDPGKVFPQAIDLSSIVDSDLLQFINDNNLAQPGVLTAGVQSFKVSNPEVLLGKTLTNRKVGYVWKF